MKFINPSEITGKILTLIEESDEFVVLVSPYFNISKWYKLLKKIEQLKDREVPLNVFVREGESNSKTFEDLEKANLDFKKIPDLHSKLYLSEKCGIVTSLNLLLNSEINSLEIGYITETEQELNELKSFCKRYLKFDVDTQSYLGYRCTDIDDIIDSIKDRLDKENINENIRVWVEDDDWILRIKTRINNYEVSFSSDDQNGNFLSISGILSGKEFELIQNQIRHIEKLCNLEIEIVKGEGNHYNMIFGFSKHAYETFIVHEILCKEADLIIQEIADFIIAVDRFKINT